MGVCINQANKGATQQGIYSLAGFAQKSRTMLVLWSKNYLKRKWCVFELAACTQAGTKMQFAPVFVETSVFLVFSVTWLIVVLYRLGRSLQVPMELAVLIAFFLIPFGISKL